MSLIERIVRRASQHYYAALVAHPEARVWYYNLYHVLEGDAEVPNLPTATGLFADEWIESRFERHADDERRHQRLWAELLQRRGQFDPGAIPDWANIVERVFTDDWFGARNVISAHQRVHPAQLIVMFSAMHALEVLGVQRFQIMAGLHRGLDPEVAALLETVVKDERFHTAYTRESALRIGRRHGCETYALECLDAGVRAFRHLGMTMFPQYVAHLQGMGVRFSPWFLLLMRVFRLLARRSPGLPPPPRLSPALVERIPYIESVFARPSLRRAG